MPYDALADFLDDLEREGELARVTAEVDAALEITEISRRVAEANGPALLFTRVRGQAFPLVTNLLGSQRRICRALEAASIDELSGRVAEWLHGAAPSSWATMLRLGTATASRAAPRIVKNAAVQQVVRLGQDIDLSALPLPRFWPEDAAHGLDGVIVAARSIDTGQQVTDWCPVRVLDRQRMAVCWQSYSPLQRQWLDYGRRQEAMPVAMTLSGHPLDTLAVLAPPATRGDAVSWRTLLGGKAVELTRCRTSDLLIPADAEIVCEGLIDPGRPAASIERGSSLTGHYGLRGECPILELTAVTHRVAPLVAVSVPGPPPHELAVVKRAMARMFLPLLRTVVPEIADCDLPLAAGQSVALVSFRKSYPRQARQVAAALWGLHPWLEAKFLVLVDEDVNLGAYPQVLWRVAANVHPARDLFFHEGVGDRSDHASPDPGLASRVAIDATRKLPEEQARSWPAELDMDRTTREQVSGRWAEYGLPALLG